MNINDKIVSNLINEFNSILSIDDKKLSKTELKEQVIFLGRKLIDKYESLLDSDFRSNIDKVHVRDAANALDLKIRFEARDFIKCKIID